MIVLTRLQLLDCMNCKSKTFLIIEKYTYSPTDLLLKLEGYSKIFVDSSCSEDFFFQFKF